MGAALAFCSLTCNNLGVASYRFTSLRASDGLEVWPVARDRWFIVEGASLAMPVAVRLGHDEDGRVVCTGLLAGFDVEGVSTTRYVAAHMVTSFENLGDDPEQVITTRDLRTIRLGEIVDAAARDLWVRARIAAIDELAPSPLPRLRKPTQARPGRRGHDPAFYERFSAIYLLEAGRSSRSPVGALAKRYDVSGAAIYRWITRARELGYLNEKENLS